MDKAASSSSDSSHGPLTLADDRQRARRARRARRHRRRDADDRRRSGRVRDDVSPQHDGGLLGRPRGRLRRRPRPAAAHRDRRGRLQHPGAAARGHGHLLRRRRRLRRERDAAGERQGRRCRPRERPERGRQRRAADHRPGRGAGRGGLHGDRTSDAGRPDAEERPAGGLERHQGRRRHLRQGPRRDRRRRAPGDREGSAGSSRPAPLDLDQRRRPVASSRPRSAPRSPSSTGRCERSSSAPSRRSRPSRPRASSPRELARADAPPIEARGLVKRYGEITAVDHVDLTVEPGDVYGYLGPNGAGKTTSLRMLLGLIRPTSGVARLFGRDPLIEGARALDGVAGFVEAPRFYTYLPRAREPRAARAPGRRRCAATASRRRSTSSTSRAAGVTRSAATRTACDSGSASRPR